MIYTVVDEKGRKQTYSGFKAVLGFIAEKIPNFLVVVMDNEKGCIELWELDKGNPQDALEELRRYYRAEGVEDPLLQLYTKS